MIRTGLATRVMIRIGCRFVRDATRMRQTSKTIVRVGCRRNRSACRSAPIVVNPTHGSANPRVRVGTATAPRGCESAPRVSSTNRSATSTPRGVLACFRHAQNLRKAVTGRRRRRASVRVRPMAVSAENRPAHARRNCQADGLVATARPKARGNLREGPGDADAAAASAAWSAQRADLSDSDSRTHKSNRRSTSFPSRNMSSRSRHSPSSRCGSCPGNQSSSDNFRCWSCWRLRYADWGECRSGSHARCSPGHSDWE
jgi:hypothetical protein